MTLFFIIKKDNFKKIKILIIALYKMLTKLKDMTILMIEIIPP